MFARPVADMSSIVGDPVTRIIPLVDERVYCLPSSYAVDGRVSWHDPEARGWATFNCYLFTGDDGAVLVDTGLTIHRDAVLAQLTELITPDMPLEIMHLRQGEFDSTCNTVPIVERFNVTGIHGIVEGGHLWADFLPTPARSAALLAKLDAVDHSKFAARPEVPVGSSGWELLIVDPPLRLLNTFWLYDPKSKTMLTSDVFSHLIARSPAGPWQVGGDDPQPDDLTVRDHLLGTRFWWLQGAELDYIRQGLKRQFSEREVVNIGPSFGSMIRGAAAVEAHVVQLDRVLGTLAKTTTADAGRGVRQQ